MSDRNERLIGALYRANHAARRGLVDVLDAGPSPESRLAFRTLFTAALDLRNAAEEIVEMERERGKDAK